ncbi:histidine phosphatase family protein [Pseudobutyrivibrio xylanivorans]|uniref:Probable phosphoglycerate mutase n=1 Tax=Pseudobutyrivibrio xylanivorans DSM 14809 TaxID=1123012 RepID=A0A1M6DZ24_PSEXY|nr:histidine phosphatase family protein [Pseudobutyrivibrio xylanivorans]SHI78502.1 probable phosphoglycerate mutase [Pseudobutyrivibrio xylanivorans DSM 14809]
MRVLLLRHGQTDLNVQKRLQGSSDIPLNERGRQQARQTKEFLDGQGIVVTRIISSPLERAIETGSLATGIPMSQIETDDNLIEMAFGVCEQRNMGEEDPGFLHQCFDTPADYIPPEGGEGYDEVVKRAGAIVERVRGMISAGDFSEDDVLLLVSHGALSHCMFEYIKKTPRTALWDVDFNNCAIAELFLSIDGGADDYKFLSDGFEKNW